VTGGRGPVGCTRNRAYEKSSNAPEPFGSHPLAFLPTTPALPVAPRLHARVKGPPTRYTYLLKHGRAPPTSHLELVYNLTCQARCQRFSLSRVYKYVSVFAISPSLAVCATAIIHCNPTRTPLQLRMRHLTPPNATQTPRRPEHQREHTKATITSADLALTPHAAIVLCNNKYGRI